MNRHKVINDPVYGFITINHPLIFNIVQHKFYQRLRRIHQMALAYLVYPGAVHTRLHHSLGAYHLMCCAIDSLRLKGVEISVDEEVAAKAAILLHDVGHGPFSHALEAELLPGIHHEKLSLYIMQKLNLEFNGALQMAIDIFTNKYPKKFLSQLVSSQLDVDRMDYLMRDSFFTGVSEGVFGWDRILKMMTVYDNELVMEEKGIHSIETFLIARRQMYWQVYLHKTVMASEKTLKNIIKRVKYLHAMGIENLKTTSVVDYFLFQFDDILNDEVLEKFCDFDDVEISYAIKLWSKHDDAVLSRLCKMILDRNLLKVKLSSQPFSQNLVDEQKQLAKIKLNLNDDEVEYFVFTGTVKNTMYKAIEEPIKILYKNGTISSIINVDDALIHINNANTVTKNYLCSLN
ncbi:MAG: HD domain-containing protein [Chitinophagaceae bacterium]